MSIEITKEEYLTYRALKRKIEEKHIRFFWQIVDIQETLEATIMNKSFERLNVPQLKGHLALLNKRLKESIGD